MEEIIVGVEEKKKTQGMRRNLVHLCGVFLVILGGSLPLFPFSFSHHFGCVFFRRAKIG